MFPSIKRLPAYSAKKIVFRVLPVSLFFFSLILVVTYVADRVHPPSVVYGGTATTTWTGLGDGTSWSDASNWDTGAPDAVHDVVVSSTIPVAIAAPADIAFDSLYLGGDTGAAAVSLTFTGNITSGNNIILRESGTLTQNNSATQTIDGTLTIMSGGVLTHSANVATHDYSVKFAADTIDIQSGGSVDVDEKGFAGRTGSDMAGYGPGGGGAFNVGGGGNGAGGGHGGAGGASQIISPGGVSYCSSGYPVTLGSGGGAGGPNGSEKGGNGGGLVIFSVTGTINIAGTISANGESTAYAGAGAGGGVNITANLVQTSPTIDLLSARGGNATDQGGGGGGGCIHITYSASNSIPSLDAGNDGLIDLDADLVNEVVFTGGTGFTGAAGIGTFQETSLNSAPSASTPYPTQSSPSAISVTSTVADADSDVTSLGVEYSTDNATWVNATIATASENSEGNGVTTSTGLISGIDTDNDGSVDLTFAWDAATDLPNTEDSSVYLRITPNDGTASGTVMTSASFNLDTKAPVAPGNLAISTTSTQSVTFTLGSASTDDNFKEYIIYYKPGASGVLVSDSAFTSSTDANLGPIDFNSALTTVLSGLATSTQYVANIWAYDNIGHLTPAASEIAFYTLADTPGTPTVTASSSATILHLTIDPATNPNTSAVTYSICKTDNGTSCAAGSSYVQSADGSLALTPDWQTYATWGGALGVEVTGLTPNTAYRFLVQARNGNSVETSLSSANAPVTTSNVGVTITQSGGTTLVTEGGVTDSYTLVLTSKPASNVTITVATDTSANIDTTTLTFTATNWDQTQTITVTANNDQIAQGSHSATITHTVTSADLTYNGISVSDVTATVTDNDTLGINLSATTADATEGGATDSYTIVLNSQPTSTVTIAVATDTATNVDATTLTFTNLNWNTPQTITITANNDLIAQGTHTGTITHTATSADGTYNGRTISDMVVTVTDNDVSGVTITQSGGTTLTTEGGATDSYTVVLTSEPTSTVQIIVATDTASNVDVATLDFTSLNWNTPQTVTVTAVNDAIAQGEHTGTITHTASSTDTGYNGSTVIASVTNTITDNDTLGINLSATTADATEGGATDSYTIVLNSQPTSTVTIAVATDTATNVDATTLTFTNLNWNTPQTITITANNDLIAQGTHTGTITHTATSADGTYNGRTISDMVVTVTDNDVSGVTITERNGSTTTTESGITDTYTVVLTSEPTSTVQIIVSSDAASTVSTGTIDFTASNWNSAVTVTVTAVNDSIAQGEHTGTITHTASSTNRGYNGSTVISDVTNTITDNDSSGVTISETAVATTEGGTTDSYTIVLDSQPTSTVQIILSPGVDMTVSSGTVNFSSSNWNTPVTITVTAIDDIAAQGTHTGTITHVASSTNTGYNASTVITSVTNTITDNEVALTGGGGATGVAGVAALPPVVTSFQTTAIDQTLLDNLKRINVPINGLVKLVNDGNVFTQEDSAVYYIGIDGKRHAFPNAKVYFTWYSSFDGVQDVTTDQIASIPLGANVTYKPGVKMVKFATDAKVYAVDKGGLLRWITSEPLAIYFYGPLWNKNIDDIDDAFYANYKFGSAINNIGDFNLAEVKASAQVPSDSLEM